MVWCLENYFFIPFPNQPGIYESTLFFSYSSFSTDQRFAKFPINDINYNLYRGGLTMFARKVMLRTRHACHIQNKMDQVCLPYKFFGD